MCHILLAFLLFYILSNYSSVSCLCNDTKSSKMISMNATNFVFFKIYKKWVLFHVSRNEKVIWSFSSTFIVRFALPLNNCSVRIQFHLMANAIHTFWSAFQVNFFKMLQVCCIFQSTIYKSSTVVISLKRIMYVSFHYAPNDCKLNKCLIQSADFCSCCFI